MADETIMIASQVERPTRIPKKIHASTAVKTNSKPLANVFRMELRDFKNRLVTIPTKALFSMIAITYSNEKNIKVK